jgi:hypothetical protein
MRRVLLAGGIVLALAGCAVPEERKAQMEASCRTYGFTPGTDGFAACMKHETMSYDPQLFGPRDTLRAGAPRNCVRPLAGGTVLC